MPTLKEKAGEVKQRAKEIKDTVKTGKFQTWRDFYPYYLSEHSNRTNRRLHFVGTFLVICTAITATVTQRPVLLWLCPFLGYGFAWVGHYFFEKNRPATFKHPFYSLFSDFYMFYEMATGRIKF